MANQDFSNIGEQIKDALQDAFVSMDFERLNRSVADTVNLALDEARKQMKKGMDRSRQCGQYSRGRTEAGTAVRSAEHRVRADRSRQEERQFRPAFRVRYNGRISGTLCTVFGGIGAGAIGIALLVLGIIAGFSGLSALASAIVFPILMLFFGGSLALMAAGISMKGRVGRLSRYLRIIGDKTWYSVSELAAATGRKDKFVRRDLDKMIRNGMLPDARLDAQGTCLMMNREAWQQYMAAMESMRQRKLAEEEQMRLNAREEQAETPQERECRKMIQEGRDCIRRLREINDAIPGEVISQKLYRLESILSKIFDVVRCHPEKAPQMRKFMEYYLPSTLKLMSAYQEFDRVDVPGENVTLAKQEIEKTLDTINTAFEQLLDDLYQDEAFGAAADAAVLQTMLASEGWTKSDFQVKGD